MNIQPLANRILVKALKTEAKTAGGIIIPDTAQEKTEIAELIAIGDDFEKIKVEVGQKVIYNRFAGTRVKNGSEEQLMLNTDDVMAIISE